MPRWGKQFKDFLADSFTRSMSIVGATTSLPLDSNNVTLDPKVRDRYGLPAARMTYHDHPDDMAMGRFLQAKGVDIMHAAGAKKVMASDDGPSTISAHLMGTCRMGDDPETSVVDRYHRSHEVPNLFLCDGSSFVTSGRGQPTMTIQALAFRAAEHIAGFSRRNEI